MEREEWEAAASTAASVAAPSETSTAGQGASDTLTAFVDVQPVLRGLDVIHAVPMARPGQTDLIADTLVSTYQTDLNQDGVLSIVLLLLDQR